MKKKIFAVSDIHNDYKALIEGLGEADYDENNPSHLLVSIGDAFDRGNSALAVYEYLKRLSDEGKAIILKGNHTDFFSDYLTGKSISHFNYTYNGTDETMADFLGRTKPFESWCLLDKGIQFPTNKDFAEWISEARKEINEEYPELLEWLQERPYYYETKNYIFTHASIDTKANNWRKPHCIYHQFNDWDACLWDDGSFFGKDIKNTDKTVVIGHFGTEQLRKKYPELTTKDKAENPYEILIRDDEKIIALDATTILSHKINVLVIEDELI